MNDEEIIKKALYHCDYENTHRETRKEAEDGMLYCPKCKTEMISMKNKFRTIQRCPNCGFFLSEDQIKQ